MTACDLLPRLGELVNLPALVVSAEFDRIAPPASGRAIAAGLKGGRYVEVAGAAHGIPLTDPDRINVLLNEHLATAESAWPQDVK